MFAGAWGKPLLLGPGTIHVAHIPKNELPKVICCTRSNSMQDAVRQLQSAA